MTLADVDVSDFREDYPDHTDDEIREIIDKQLDDYVQLMNEIARNPNFEEKQIEYKKRNELADNSLEQ